MDEVTTVPAPAGSEAVSALCRRYGVRRLDLVGSGTGNRFDPVRSDLDFLVDFGGAVGAAYAGAYFGLREGLEALFLRPVDLVTEAALQNPYLRARMEAQRQRLFPAP